MSMISLAIHPSAPAPIRNADYGAPVTITPLDAGSVWAVTHDNALLVIWYVDSSHFLTLMRNGELSARCLALRAISEHAYMVISGSLRVSGWPWPNVQAALLSAQECGVGTLYARDATEAAELIQQLGRRDRTPKRVRPARDVLFFSPGEDMLLAIPGLGEKRLDQLLASTGGNAALALSALTDPSITIPNMPKNVREEARRVLGLPDGIRLGLDTIPQEEATNDQHTNGAEQPDALAVAAHA